MTRRTEIRGSRSPEIVKKIAVVKAGNVRDHSVEYIVQYLQKWEED